MGNERVDAVGSILSRALLMFHGKDMEGETE